MPTSALLNTGLNKYMVIVRRTGNTQDLVFENYTFQAVTDFKYLGTNINSSTNIHNEIKLRISETNKGYLAVEKSFKSML
jgi:hypothetical protein